ncbi:class I SAM-dependent methyltransferase [Candidatus Micrarchaeota archaeon]|nr:class I SAM-dependent methyltransferase [Candidatus Micrarchaeota archaeon]
MKLHQLAWEKDYAKRGSLWRGSSGFDPKLPKKTKILELGVGNGKNLTALVHAGYSVYAIDSSQTAVKMCRELLKKFKKKAVLKTEDCCSLSFENNFFDAVVAFHTIGHLTAAERIQSVKEIFRVLKPGGIVFFKDFGLRDMRYGKGTLVEKDSFKRGNGIWYHYFTEKELRELFKEFKTKELGIESWKVFFAGKDYYRQEVHGVFEK